MRRRAGRARGTWRSVVVGALCGAAAGALVAGPAFADPPSPTDYRTTITGITPAVPGLAARMIAGDSFFELTVPAGVEVVVIGYQQEPYLRFGADGTVQENRRSPTVGLNANRYGATAPQPGADASAAPDWHVVGHGQTWVWHDHRTHWMSTTPPLNAHRGDQILESAVPLTVDGRPVSVLVSSTWARAPSSMPPLAGAFVALVLAGVVLGWRRPVTEPAARGGAAVLVVAAVGALTVGLWQTWSVPSSTGPPATAWALPAVALVVALAALARPWSAFTAVALRIVAAGQLVVWLVLRREVLVRAILPTDLPYWVDRLVTAAAGAAAVAAGASALVGLVRMMVGPRPTPAR